MGKQRKGGTKRNLIGYPCIRIPGPIAKGAWRGVHEIPAPPQTVVESTG